MASSARAQVGQRPLVHEAAAHHHGSQAAAPGGRGDVEGVFDEDGRLVVRERDDRRGAPDRLADDLIRRFVGHVVVAGARLRELPVLAELAAQRAARRAERVGRRARQEVVEGLLLDRVDVHRQRSAVRQAPQLPADVLAHAAAAAGPGLDGAPLGAELAEDGACARGRGAHRERPAAGGTRRSRRRPMRPTPSTFARGAASAGRDGSTPQSGAGAAQASVRRNVRRVGMGQPGTGACTPHPNPPAVKWLAY